MIKFWPSRAAEKGACSGAKFFGSTLLQPARSVCLRLSVLFHYHLLSLAATISRMVWNVVSQYSFLPWRRKRRLNQALSASLSVGFLSVFCFCFFAFLCVFFVSWRCSAIIKWTEWTLAMTCGHDDSTINIVMGIIIIITIAILSCVLSLSCSG